MKVLFFGSNLPLGRVVKRGLAEEGVDVDLAVTPSEVAMLARIEGHDAIVCDLRHPDRDVSFVKDWRKSGVKTPVLLLTTPAASGEAVNGLKRSNENCVSILAKPFNFEQLLARLYSLRTFNACA